MVSTKSYVKIWVGKSNSSSNLLALLTVVNIELPIFTGICIKHYVYRGKMIYEDEDLTNNNTLF